MPPTRPTRKSWTCSGPASSSRPSRPTTTASRRPPSRQAWSSDGASGCCRRTDVSFALDAVGLVHPNGHRALQSVSLAAAGGERVAVIGPSGAGKTTLLRVLGAALRPGEGSVRLLGEAPWHLTAPALRGLRARIGTVHQSPPIAPRLRVVTAVLAGRLGQWSALRALGSLLR